jgi:hypothetical protein
MRITLVTESDILGRRQSSSDGTRITVPFDRRRPQSCREEVMKNAYGAIMPAVFAMGCLRPGEVPPVQFSNAPPPAECVLLGPTSASAMQQSGAYANRAARSLLAIDANRRGANYIQVTSEDKKTSDFGFESILVRIEGALYRCPASGDDAGSSAVVLTVPGAASLDAGTQVNAATTAATSATGELATEVPSGPGTPVAPDTQGTPGEPAEPGEGEMEDNAAGAVPDASDQR